MASREKQPDAFGWISLGGKTRHYRNVVTGETISRRAYRQQYQLGGQRIERVAASRDLPNIANIKTQKARDKQIDLRLRVSNAIADINQGKKTSSVLFKYHVTWERIGYERAKIAPTIVVHLYDNKGVAHEVTLSHCMASSIGTYLEATRKKDKKILKLYSEMQLIDVATGDVITLPRYDARIPAIISRSGMHIKEYKGRRKSRYAA